MTTGPPFGALYLGGHNALDCLSSLLNLSAIPPFHVTTLLLSFSVDPLGKKLTNFFFKASDSTVSEYFSLCSSQGLLRSSAAGVQKQSYTIHERVGVAVFR